MGHTPGPWEVIRHDEFESNIGVRNGESVKWVALVRGQDDATEQVANANLIAAAPKLKEENERFSILLNECFGVFDNLGIESKLRDKIVKALNDADDRATGVTP